MKKILSLALAIAMLFALSVPAIAAEAVTNITGNTTGDVEVVIVPENDPETPGDESVTYAVSLVWDSMEFTYTGTWDPEELAYTGSWDKTSANITVTNSSNAAVDVDAYFDTLGTAAKTTSGVTATLTNYDFRLNAASDTGVATTKAITVSVTGAPKVTSGFSVGTVTVAISTVD